MSKLHSVGRANKGLFSSLRLFGLASVVAVAGLLTAPAMAQTCEFDDPTAAPDGNGGWKEDSGSFGIEYLLGGTNDTTSLPTVSDANAAACPGEGTLSYKLYMADGTTALTAADVGGTMTFVLLTLADGDPEADPLNPSTITVPENTADAGSVASGATVTYNVAGAQSDFHRMAPMGFVLKAEKAFSGGEGAEFAFSVTVRPVPHAAPTDVFATSESYNSIYVEWTGDSNNSNATVGSEADDTTATSYMVTASWTPEGAMEASMRSVTVMDTAMGTLADGTSPTSPRQSATVTGLPANTSFTISVMGVSGMGYAGNEGTAASPAAAVMTAALTYTSMEPYTVSVDETVDLDISDFIDPEIDESATDVTADDPTNTDDPTNDNMQRPVGTSFMITATAGNTAVRVEHITDDDMDHTDDILRLHGLSEGTYTVVLTATAMFGGMAGDVIMASIPVKVVENHEPMFRISEATVDWDIDNVGGAFEINVMTDFVDKAIFDADQVACVDEDASNDINCDHELTFTLSGGAGYLHITEDNEKTGKITASSVGDPDFEAVEDGRQFELTVTATDQSGAKDTMKIFVDVIEGNDTPQKKSARAGGTDVYLQPLATSTGGGSRSTNVASKFSDREGDDLCFEITSSSLADADDDSIVLAEASLAGASTCMNGHLTISMNLPSTDPEDDNFDLLGRYGTDRVSVTVAAFQRGATPKVLTDGVTVYVDLVYGPNTGPNIRTVALMGDTHVTSGVPKINEGDDINITFTADDAQPSGDRICWSKQGACRPCNGDEFAGSDRRNFLFGFVTAEARASNNAATATVSHEYQVRIPGYVGVGQFRRNNTDFESRGGVYRINLCATDLAGETDRITFEVMIEDVEEAPTIGDIDPIYMLIGDYSQEVRIPARDGDGSSDIVEYGANCIGGCGPVSISEEDGVVTVTPSENEIGSADTVDKVEVEVEVSATDSTGNTAYASFMVHVKDSNTAPGFDDGLTGATFSVPENSRAGTGVGSALAVSDADMGDTVSAAVSGTDMFRASVVRTSDAGDEETTYGVQISVAKSGLDFEGDISSYDFAVSVEDKYGGANSIDVRVDVTDVNERPMIVEDSGDIEEQRILVGITQCNILASDHFMDPDHRDQQAGLFIEASSTRPGDASVSVQDNNAICITGENVGNGPARVRITATDRDDLSVSKTFRVTVEANMPPMVVGDGIPDMMADEGGRTDDIALNMYFDDGDAAYMETLHYEFEVDNPGVATGALIGYHTLRVYGDEKGTAMVTVTATDQNDQSVSDTFEVEVTRNDPPVAHPDFIDDVFTRLGIQEEPIDATGAFTDEGDTLTYSVSTDDPDVATTAIKYDDEGGPWIVVHSHSVGTTTCTMKATDSGGNYAKVEFTIEVGPRNDAPTVANAIDDVTMMVDERHDVELEDVFDDEGSLDIDVANEDETVADVVHRRSQNEIRIYANAVGTTTVTVTATDNIGQSVSDQFDVTVEAAPEAVGVIADQTLQIGGEDLDLNVSPYFTHRGGDVLSYTVSTDGSTAATITNLGSNLNMVPFTRGSTEVTVTATDSKGRSATQSFTTIVSDSELRTVAEAALAGQGRAFLNTVSNVVGTRLESNRSDTGINIAQYMPTGDASYQPGSEFSANQGMVGFTQAGSQPIASSGSSWNKSGGTGNAMNLNSIVSRNFSQTLNGKGGIGSWSLWSSTDTRNFAGEGYSGNTTSTFMGLDLLANKRWLVGVTGARNTGQSTYSWGTATQSMDTEMLTVMPYFNYEPSSKTTVWGVFGLGAGDVISTVVNASSQSSDLSMNLGMLGGKHKFGKIGNIELALRGDAAFANLATDSGDGAVDGLSANVQRIRAGVETSTSFDMGRAGTIKPFGELAFRSDTGDGATGTGVEVGGGVRVQTNVITIEARGHRIANHSAKDFSESGFTLKAELAPSSTDGSGFRMSIAPTWGQSSVEGSNGIFANATHGQALPYEDVLGAQKGMTFDTSIGYGFRFGNDRYLVSPFVESRTLGANVTTSQIGVELKQLVKMPRTFDMKFTVGRLDTGLESSHQVGANATIKF